MNAQPARKSLQDVTALKAEIPGPEATAEAAPSPKPRRTRRKLLIVALPLALALGGGYMWATGGRYVSTEDAYVKQDRVAVMPQVSGQIAQVMVGENDQVQAGQTLFTIDESTYRNAVEEDQAKLQSARLEVEKLKAGYAQAQAEVETAREALATAQTQDDRQRSLLAKGVVSQSVADDSALKLQQAKGALAQAESQVLSAKSGARRQPRDPDRPSPDGHAGARRAPCAPNSISIIP